MPNRIIKESICKSDTIDSLSWFEEVLFYRLIVVCDDYGRFDGRPAVIKGSCFPLKDDITKKHISEAIQKLSTVGLVRGYEVCGKSYLQLTTWDCHQQKRAKNSKYPSPDEGTYKNTSDDSVLSKTTSPDNNLNHMISDDIKCTRESRNEKRETRIENRESNARASADGELRRFEDFWAAYPNDKNRYLAERAYMGLVVDGVCSEDDLVAASKNYAEFCKISGTDKIYYANNFLEKCVFEDYLPGRYKRPEKKKPGDKFANFHQREYDYDSLEQKLLHGG